MQFSDLYSGAGLSGLATGAASGAVVGGIPGAVIGGGLGLFTGASANDQRDQASANQQKSMSEIVAKMRAAGTASYKQHIADLEKALSYYGPAQEQWSRLYSPGTGSAQTGQGDWAGTGVK